MWRIFPAPLQVEQRADLILERHLGIDAVELVEVDPLQPEPAEAPLARRPQVLGAAVRDPGAGAGRWKPAFVAITRPAG